MREGGREGHARAAAQLLAGLVRDVARLRLPGAREDAGGGLHARGRGHREQGPRRRALPRGARALLRAQLRRLFGERDARRSLHRMGAARRLRLRNGHRARLARRGRGRHPGPEPLAHGQVPAARQRLAHDADAEGHPRPRAALRERARRDPDVGPALPERLRVQEVHDDSQPWGRPRREAPALPGCRLPCDHQWKGTLR
mmetsp:Transcript_107617/g.304403  ORF Transcript_107617/g.304403 Transcript_107617/m.304403 type:complete len:200 (-) Transcript_107617:273-872(-)